MPTFEEQSAQDLRDTRDRYRRAIASLDRSKPENQVLAELAAQSLDLQHKLEDLVLAHKTAATPATALPLCIDGLRSGSVAAANIFGRATAAAKYTCAGVASSIDDDDLPGFSSSQLKSIRSSHASQLSAASVNRQRESPYSQRLSRFQFQLRAAQSTLSNLPQPPPALLPTPPPLRLTADRPISRTPVRFILAALATSLAIGNKTTFVGPKTSGRTFSASPSFSAPVSSPSPVPEISQALRILALFHPRKFYIHLYFTNFIPIFIALQLFPPHIILLQTLFLCFQYSH